MKPWLDTPYKVTAPTFDELNQLLIEVFGVNENGSLIKNSHNHSIMFTTPMIETGNLILDEEGNQYPERVPKEGAFAEVRVREPVPELNAFSESVNSSVAEYYEHVAQNTRVAAEYASLPFGKALIQAGKGKDGIRGIDRLNRVLTEVSIHPERSDETLDWISEDNSIVHLKLDDVKGIVSSFSSRQQSLFEQYALWRSGDKQEPFVFNSKLP